MTILNNTNEVKIMKKMAGPIVVMGPVKLTDDKGKEYETPKAFSLCGCGQSSNLPFCDGTHKTL